MNILVPGSDSGIVEVYLDNWPRFLANFMPFNPKANKDSQTLHNYSAAHTISGNERKSMILYSHIDDHELFMKC